VRPETSQTAGVGTRPFQRQHNGHAEHEDRQEVARRQSETAEKLHRDHAYGHARDQLDKTEPHGLGKPGELVIDRLGAVNGDSTPPRHQC
jgi:hypothetical protein